MIKEALNRQRAKSPIGPRVPNNGSGAQDKRQEDGKIKLPKKPALPPQAIRHKSKPEHFKLEKAEKSDQDKNSEPVKQGGMIKSRSVLAINE